MCALVVGGGRCWGRGGRKAAVLLGEGLRVPSRARPVGLRREPLERTRVSLVSEQELKSRCVQGNRHWPGSPLGEALRP